ncbi:thiamine biosynthesis protein ThiS [Pseudoalteromonas porphyrae]|uniref:Thiamine biosynthesis protein ThiS n=2 Tax=Pseudoalteromonas TaxID=53246 RepID=A0A0N1EAN1_9GAMM|nr:MULTISPECIES: sulfur carrier protein ThiS [Pseudoalteromonas]KPH56975.1 thiamine biosynthesis protein ThiS [Pseudoalteromonas porphyrae]KPH96706.1 thiamine biosynthesis protein ThiS [Pseudoalteromonas porphyrae]NMR26210.1 sulfur carrier protein ThiS [Pseudoalteromonas sp. NEC-BIFX-2020_015]NNG44470.1 sulfur carrier protein ThiS [Pseudoalteromonas sp. NEC-BIFX-2020_002]
MNIMINGQPFVLSDKHTLLDALSQFGAKEPFAVALNGVFIARSLCADTQLNEGDSLELLSPIQGG